MQAMCHGPATLQGALSHPVMLHCTRSKLDQLTKSCSDVRSARRCSRWHRGPSGGLSGHQL